MIAEALHPGILFYLSGLLSLLAGLAIINLHNTWYADWRVIITVLGWLMTIGGIIRVVLPQIAMVPRHVADGMRDQRHRIIADRVTQCRSWPRQRWGFDWRGVG